MVINVRIELSTEQVAQLKRIADANSMTVRELVYSTAQNAVQADLDIAHTY